MWLAIVATSFIKLYIAALVALLQVSADCFHLFGEFAQQTTD